MIQGLYVSVSLQPLYQNHAGVKSRIQHCARMDTRRIMQMRKPNYALRFTDGYLKMRGPHHVGDLAGIRDYEAE